MNTSVVEAVLSRLAMTDVAGLSIYDAGTLRDLHVLPFRADVPALLVGSETPGAWPAACRLLVAVYPLEHPVSLLDSATRTDLSLGEFSLSTPRPRDSALFIPPLPAGTSFEALTEVVAHLRAPDGCPWDREQTHASLRTHLLEEAYETLAAIDAGEVQMLGEELGDLMLQIVLHAQIASESQAFSMLSVVRGIHDKIIRRHPHVFGDLEVGGVEGVLKNWERLKEHERTEKKAANGLLGGVPLTLPALAQSQEYQERAARVGFDWPEMSGVLEKIAEEVAEVQAARTPVETAAELGDLFFVLVNFARWKHVDAESALRQANARFRQRFGYIERAAADRQRRVSDLTFEEMDALWRDGKAANTTP